MLTLQ